MSPSRNLDVAQAYAVRLMQHLVVPTFVLNPKRQVVIWNRACERLTGVMAAEVLGTNQHWRAFYETKRYCLADLVALGRPDKLATLYSQHAVPEDGLGFCAENYGRNRMVCAENILAALAQSVAERRHRSETAKAC